MNSKCVYLHKIIQSCSSGQHSISTNRWWLGNFFHTYHESKILRMLLIFPNVNTGVFTFSVRNNNCILDFVGHMACIMITQFCLFHAKTTMNNECISEWEWLCSYKTLLSKNKKQNQWTCGLFKIFWIPRIYLKS